MNKLRDLNLKRAFSGISVFVMLVTLFSSVLTVLMSNQTVSAQAPITFEWYNAGTIKAGDITYYDKDPFDKNREFIQAGGSTCSYATSGLNNIPMDKIYLDSNTAGTRFLVDQNKKDAAGRLTCETIASPVTTANDFNAKYKLYRVGDTISSYNNGISFNKTGANINTPNSTGVEVFTRSGEGGERCPDIIVHGVNGDYNGWFIFPMAPKDTENATDAISERYADFIPNSGDCRVAPIEIETEFHIGFAQDKEVCEGTDKDNPCTEGVPTYPGEYVIPPGWGDDGYSIVAGVGTQANAPPAGAPPPGSGTNPEEEAKKTACDISFGFVDYLALKWLMCPIIDIMMSSVEFLENFLISQLLIKTEPLASDQPYHDVWASFRTIALAIIIIVALVMVIFEATGIEAFSAYTMRSLLTRFGVAVLFIVLSWSVLGAVVEIMNGFTNGARELIYSPFDGKLPDNDLTGGASIMLFMLGTGGILALGPWGLLSFVLTALISIFITVLVLVIVQALLYLIIMTSPIFIALSVLPNTRKGYEFGKGLFAAIVFGTIAVAVAMPALDMMAATMYHQQGGSTLHQIIALIIKFGRVFVVIFIFTKVGGVLGAITGVVSGLGNSAQAGLKNFRGNQVKSRHADVMEGRRKLLGSQKASGLYQHAAGIRDGGLGLTSKQRANYASAREKRMAGVTHKMLEEDHGRAAGNDDATAIAMQGNMNRQKFIAAYQAKTGQTAAEAEKALSELETGFGAKIGTRAMEAASFKAHAASNTGYKPNANATTDAQRDAHYQQMLTDAGRMVNNGTMSAADAAAALKANKNRPDMAGMSFGKLLPAIDKAATNLQSGQAAADHTTIKDLRQSVLDGSQPGALIGARHEAVTSMSHQMFENLQAAYISKDSEAISRELAAIAGRYDVMAHAAPQNAEIMAKTVLSQNIRDQNGNIVTVRQAVEARRGDAQFLDRRREIGRGEHEAYQNAQQYSGVGGGGGIPGMGGTP